jgi:phosphoribosylformylglycinamidine (FGAM) synthase-like enzyme
VLLGEGFGELGGSEYLKALHQTVKGQPPLLDLDRERRLIGLLGRAAGAGILRSAHDCSDGGLAVTLAECAFDTGGIGFDVDAPSLANGVVQAVDPASPIGLIAALFGESASRAVVSVRRADRATLLQMAADAGVPAQLIGNTGGSRLMIRCRGNIVIDTAVADAERIWSDAIARHFKGRAA